MVIEREGLALAADALADEAHALGVTELLAEVVEVVDHQAELPVADQQPPAPDGLKILLVGELAYNGERILVLEERGHSLHGLWIADPYWFSTVGPVPFGHVRDVPRANWRTAVRELRPDIIYALLNWQAVPLAHEVLSAGLRVPLVWHLKEGPWHCISQGTWDLLVDLMAQADGRIHSSREIRDWWAVVMPGAARNDLDLVLDGDLPKRDWFGAAPARRLSEDDGEIHTVVPGRMMGVEPNMVGELAARGVHIHVHGQLFPEQRIGLPEGRPTARSGPPASPCGGRSAAVGLGALAVRRGVAPRVPQRQSR